jgi:hypothetical protein
MDVKSRKSIRSLPVGGSSFALPSRHGELSTKENYMCGRREESTPTSLKISFLTVKAQNNIKI